MFSANKCDWVSKQIFDWQQFSRATRSLCPALYRRGDSASTARANADAAGIHWDRFKVAQDVHIHTYNNTPKVTNVNRCLLIDALANNWQGIIDDQKTQFYSDSHSEAKHLPSARFIWSKQLNMLSRYAFVV